MISYRKEGASVTLSSTCDFHVRRSIVLCALATVIAAGLTTFTSPTVTPIATKAPALLPNVGQ